MSSRLASGDDDLGTLLRGWRAARGKSQLHVALEANVSQRHLSFIESGRSAPSREVVLAVAGALEVPLRARNELLVAAGYAPLYSEAGWNDADMRCIGAAVERMLRQQEPYPSVLMDRYWNVVLANDASARFFGSFVDLDAVRARTGRRNLLHLMFDPAGMRPFVHDWRRVSEALLERVRREAIGHVIDDRTRELLGELAAYPGVPPERAADEPETSPTLPVFPLSFVRNGMVLNYFSMVTTVGAARTVAAQELRVECLFPADESTEAGHAAIMAAGRA